MIEDLYTDRVTIRQVRQSYIPQFPMRQVWETIKGMGGPGIKEDKNYLICPSSAFCGVVLTQLAGLIRDQMQVLMLHNCIGEYCRRYPLTMLIQD